jgi:hypothetical protein
VSKLPIWVVYKSTPHKNSKPKLMKFENTVLDDILNGNKKKPLILNNYEIVAIGVGSGFETLYKEKFKITSK